MKDWHLSGLVAVLGVFTSWLFSILEKPWLAVPIGWATYIFVAVQLYQAGVKRRRKEAEREAM